MRSIFEEIRRWQAAAGETNTLLSRNSELLARRVALLRRASFEFRDVVRLARDFADEAAAGQDPAARSASPRRR